MPAVLQIANEHDRPSFAKGVGSLASGETAESNEEDEDAEVGKRRFAHPDLPTSRNIRHSVLYTAFPETNRSHGDRPKFHRIMLVLSSR